MSATFPERIAVLCLPGIGDALMATPMIALLRKAKPAATIDVICMFTGVEYVFRHNNHINHVHRLPLYGDSPMRGLGQLLSLRQNRYDISLMPLPAYRREYHIAHRLIGAKRRITHRFAKGHCSELHFLNTDLIPVDETTHNVLNNLNLLAALGIDWKQHSKETDIRYLLTVPQPDLDFGRQFITRLGWQDNEIVAIHPGSTNSPAALLRRWPLPRYAEVAKRLIARSQKVIIFVGPDEIGCGHELRGLIADDKNCALAENLGFGQSVGLLAATRLLICNDNGFGHVANALGIRSINLFASTFDRWSGPYDKQLATIVRPPGFAPWYRYDLKRAIPPGATGGMELITTQAILDLLD